MGSLIKQDAVCGLKNLVSFIHIDRFQFVAGFENAIHGGDFRRNIHGFQLCAIFKSLSEREKLSIFLDFFILFYSGFANGTGGAINDVSIFIVGR